jgi:NADH:ubiquinone oxidoreductase subunit 5 (subunit L)/multisubunit Na+/H+ antiporter MnhA subunit
LKNLIFIILLFLLIIITIISLAQNRIKLILSYSTITYILFTFVYLSLNTEQSIDWIKFNINFMINIYNYFIIIFVFFIINYFIF